MAHFHDAGLRRIARSWALRNLAHSEHVASLTGFRDSLLPSRLPFVAPTAGARTAPDALFALLTQDSEKPGILLVWWRVGKTRAPVSRSPRWQRQRVGVVFTCFPIKPRSPRKYSNPSSCQVIAQTLLVFDYIDRMQWLDFGAMERGLIPQAQQRGIHVALLANCRLGWVRSNRHGAR